MYKFGVFMLIAFGVAIISAHPLFNRNESYTSEMQDFNLTTASAPINHPRGSGLNWRDTIFLGAGVFIICFAIRIRYNQIRALAQY